MLKSFLHIGLFGAYVLMVLVFGFFLWQTLFASEENSEGNPESKPAYSEQQRTDENTFRTSAPPSKPSGTDEAIAEYTKWLAIFTMFLVLVTVGLFISGERNVQVANKSAIAAKDAAIAAKKSADQTANVERPYLFIVARPQANVPKEGPYLPNPKVIYEPYNMGRVPAVVRLLSCEFLLVEDLDPKPTWDPKYFKPTLRAIGASNRDTELPPCEIDKPLSPEDWDAIKSGKKFLLFKGVFVYEGALDATYVTSVGYRIDMFDGSSIAVGGGIYNNEATEPGRGSENGTFMLRKLKLTPQQTQTQPPSQPQPSPQQPQPPTH